MRILRRSRKDGDERRAPEAEFLTRVELSTFLATCHRLFPYWYPFVLLLARTGMRLGEALGLEWGDVDFNGRFAQVRRSIVERRVETPKSGKSRRIDLSLHLTETLRVLRHRQRKVALQAGNPAPVRLFPGVDPDNFRKRDWQRLLEKAELRQVPIKALRHTFASLLIAQGESLAYVRDQLGHHSIQITVDHYGIWCRAGIELPLIASTTRRRNRTQPPRNQHPATNAKCKATQGIRTLDLPITNRLLYHLS